MPTIWEQLGAWVYSAENLSQEHVVKFHAAGGRWLTPLLHGDKGEVDGYDLNREELNLTLLPKIKSWCGPLGVRVGMHANGFGEDPKQLAAIVAQKAYAHKLNPVWLDLEAAYQHPQGNAALMPITLKEARLAMPAKSLGVSSFGFADRGMIWNGRTLSPKQSLYDLKIRWGPQWYYKYAAHYAADECMRDLKEHGATDGNIADATAPGGRGIPLPYAHGVVELTGVEGHELSVAIEQMRRAKQFGFRFGFSIFPLERCPDSDYDLLRSVRGELFLT